MATKRKKIVADSDPLRGIVTPRLTPKQVATMRARMVREDQERRAVEYMSMGINVFARRLNRALRIARDPEKELLKALDIIDALRERQDQHWR